MGDVEYVLNLVKGCWPDFNITKENLLHPTPELVLNFYSCFVNEYNDTVRYLTGVSVANEPISVDLKPEERLYQQLSKLMLGVQSFKFALADIYAPTAIRTKNFFKLCSHFVAFMQNVILNEASILIENEVFKTKEDTRLLLIEQEELLKEINENAINKELNERNKNFLEQEYKSTKKSYKEMEELKARKEKLCAEKKQQIEALKLEMQKEEHELKCLEAVKKDLLQQGITERDYHNILQTLETLKAESEMLGNDDINIEDGLVHENEVLLHSANCFKKLSQFGFNFKNVKDLKNKEDELKAKMNKLEKLNENKRNFIERQKPEGEKKLLVLQESFADLQNEHKDIKERYMHSINQFSQEKAAFKGNMEEKSQNNGKIILQHKEDIKKFEEDLEKLKKTFTNQYIRVSKVERRVVDNFKDMLEKCNSF